MIETGLASEATVVFFDASVLQLGPGTRIQLSEARRPGASNGEITVFQWVGSTWSVVTSFTDSQTRYQVETPSAIGIVRGTEFLTKVSGDGDSKFGVFDGEVRVKSKKNDGDDDEPANVSSGSSAIVTQDPSADGPVVSDWQPSDQESSELDQARDQHDDAKAALADASGVVTGDDGDDGASNGGSDSDENGNSGAGGNGKSGSNGNGKSGSDDDKNRGNSGSNDGGKSDADGDDEGNSGSGGNLASSGQGNSGSGGNGKSDADDDGGDKGNAGSSGNGTSSAGGGDTWKGNSGSNGNDKSDVGDDEEDKGNFGPRRGR